METYRVASTVSAVGPRGQTFLDSNSDLIFALQTAAGYKPDAAPGLPHNAFWPWSYLISDDTGLVELTAWVIKKNAGGGTTVKKIAMTVLPVNDQKANTFPKSVQTEIEAVYSKTSEKLDLSLYLPSELSNIDKDSLPELLQRNFPARVGYLSGLPGDLSNSLLSTLYVSIGRDDLFVKSGKKWVLLDDYQHLWITPDQINLDAVYTLRNDPESDLPDSPDLWRQTDDTNSVVLRGPAYDLERYLSDYTTALFNLESHWSSVGKGDARLLDLDSLLSTVLNPLSETRSIPLDYLSDRIKYVDDSNDKIALSKREIEIVYELWQVQSLAGLLSDDSGIVKEAHRTLLISLDDPDNIVAQLEVLNKETGYTFNDDLLEAIKQIGRRFGLKSSDNRQLLKAVAAKATMSGLQEWIRAAYAQVGDFPQFESVIDAWTSMDADNDKQRLERQNARLQIALAESLKVNLVAPFLATLDNSVSDVIKHLREEKLKTEVLMPRWDGRLNGNVFAALVSISPSNSETAVKSLEFALLEREVLAVQYINVVWPNDSNGCEGAGRPLPLVFGEPNHRLIHVKGTLDKDPRASDETVNSLDEVTGTALMIRRYDTKAGLENQPWKIVSAAVSATGHTDGLFVPEDNKTNWLQRLLVVPEENAFFDGVLRFDRGFDGQLRHIRSPLEIAYHNAGTALTEQSDADAYDYPYTYQGLGEYRGANADIKSMVDVVKAPPLRFGDHYEIAVPIIDAAGGLPSALTTPNSPWRVTPSKIDSNTAIPEDKSVVLCYRRCQPVGDINVLPGTVNGQWPVVPKRVTLRAREWHRVARESVELEASDHDNLPEVLLRAGDEFIDQHQQFLVNLEPPSIDEFTLRRWTTPPKSMAKAERKIRIAKIKKALVRIYQNRNQGNYGFVPESMVHDPAVDNFGVRVQVFDAGGIRVIHKEVDQVIRLLDTAIDFRKQPVQLECSIDAEMTRDRLIKTLTEANNNASQSARRIPLPLPPGWFASVEIWPLITTNDYIDRFESMGVAMSLADDAKDPVFTGFKAFKAAQLLVEVASSVLPDASSLFEGFKVLQDQSKVRISWQGKSDQPGLEFIDRYTVHRDRWQWRNRPVPQDKEITVPNDRETYRLSASGLPKNAFKPNLIHDDQGVRNWEQRAALDRGFADRGPIQGSWPRVSPESESMSVRIAHDAELALDERDRYRGGDYLRYHLTVHSRYSPLLKNGRVSTIGGNIQRPHDGRRRIVMPYSGPTINPPKIFSVLPLTRQFENDPFSKKEKVGVPGFLVMVDETWFREYGIGERLEASLVLETLDIGESEEHGYTGRPYRTGPLPDHWLSDPALYNYFRGKKATDEQDESDPIIMRAFGPFGYTLDTAPDEALANVSAFVVYPPEDIGPQFASFVKFRRVLDYAANNSRASSSTDAYAMYTLPDAENLVKHTEEKQTGSMILSPSNADNMEYDTKVSDLQLELDPLSWSAGTNSAWEQKSRNAALKNYRYFMLVSEALVVAGQNQVIEKPVSLTRVLHSGGVIKIQRLKNSPEFIPNESEPGSGGLIYKARILEVLVNGRYPNVQSRLDPTIDERGKVMDDITIRDFWDSVLQLHPEKDAALHDAAGMIRRVSMAFDVVVKPS